jgi:PmbA protein
MGRALANSRGFSGAYHETWASVGVSVIADDEQGKKRNGAWSTSSRYIDQLESTDEVGRIAAMRAATQLGGGPIATAKLPIVFDPLMAASLIGTLFGVLTGSAIERRSSFLLDRMGEQIASPLLTLVDDPLIARAPGSRPYDGEGLPAHKTVFIDAGTLRSWALNTYNARRLGLKPTGHASRPASGSPGESASNLYLANGNTPVADLIGGIDRGFYCESMMGFGFNPATGDFSRGASGRLIENGKLTSPVSEITISSNFSDILMRIDGLGDDLRMRRSLNSPTLRVSEMTVGGR